MNPLNAEKNPLQALLHRTSQHVGALDEEGWNDLVPGNRDPRNSPCRSNVSRLTAWRNTRGARSFDVSYNLQVRAADYAERVLFIDRISALVIAAFVNPKRPEFAVRSNWLLSVSLRSILSLYQDYDFQKLRTIVWGGESRGGFDCVDTNLRMLMKGIANEYIKMYNQPRNRNRETRETLWKYWKTGFNLEHFIVDIRVFILTKPGKRSNMRYRLYCPY